LEKPVDIIGRGSGIDRGDAGTKQLGEDVRGSVSLRFLQGQIGVAEPCEVQNGRDFHPAVFVKG
jgi:hypothetical protein